MAVSPYDGPEAIWAQGQINQTGGQNNTPTSIPQSTPVPGILVEWGSVPDITPTPPSTSSSSSGTDSSSPPAPTFPSFTIDLAAVRSAEGLVLTSVRSLAMFYNSTVQNFMDVKDTVYGQDATYLAEQRNEDGDHSAPTFVQTPDPLQQQAQEFANGGTKNTPIGINAYQEYLFSQIANAVLVVGQYLDLVNAAADAYAQSDAYSALPPVQKGGTNGQSS
jgi:hypothetical protein